MRFSASALALALLPSVALGEAGGAGYPNLWSHWEWCCSDGDCHDACDATEIFNNPLWPMFGPCKPDWKEARGVLRFDSPEFKDFNDHIDNQGMPTKYCDGGTQTRMLAFQDTILEDVPPWPFGSPALNDPVLVRPFCRKWYQFKCCTDPGACGEPHFKTWRGEYYDYQGACDMVLLHAPSFQNKLGLDIHIRTKIKFDYSYIETAAIKIGNDVLEISAWGMYTLNGVEGVDLPGLVGGMPVAHKKQDDKEHIFDIFIGDDRRIVIKTFKEWVSIKIENPAPEDFEDSTGMMGGFDSGKLLGRDGVTEFDDHDAFGQEWQIQPEEAGLFQAKFGPQYPEKCELPPPMDVARRLGENAITEEQANEACAHWKSHKKFCVKDVLASQDLDYANAGVI